MKLSSGIYSPSSSLGSATEEHTGRIASPEPIVRGISLAGRYPDIRNAKAKVDSNNNRAARQRSSNEPARRRSRSFEPLVRAEHKREWISNVVGESPHTSTRYKGHIKRDEFGRVEKLSSPGKGRKSMGGKRVSWIPANYGNDTVFRNKDHVSFNVKLGHTHENKSRSRLGVHESKMADSIQGSPHSLDNDEALGDASNKVRFTLDGPNQYDEPQMPRYTRHGHMRLESPNWSPLANRKPFAEGGEETRHPLLPRLYERFPMEKDDDQHSLNDEEINRELMLYLEHGSPAGGRKSGTRKTPLSSAAGTSAVSSSSASRGLLTTTPNSNVKFIQEEEHVKRNLNQYRQEMLRGLRSPDDDYDNDDRVAGAESSAGPKERPSPSSNESPRVDDHDTNHNSFASKTAALSSGNMKGSKGILHSLKRAMGFRSKSKSKDEAEQEREREASNINEQNDRQIVTANLSFASGKLDGASNKFLFSRGANKDSGAAIEYFHKI